MKRFSFIFSIIIFCTGNILGQNNDTIKVHQLDSITILERAPQRSREVTVGTRVSSISSATLESNKARSLSELLSDNSTIYIKSLGQGAMATASFRGTAASHTKVNWNGIALNPSMSNTFDFSQLPVFFADDVALYHGSGHLKNGTGALGGSVNVSNVADWSDHSKAKAFVEIGSYDTYTGAATVRFKREKSLFKTRIYHQQSENNYKYLNKVFKLEDFYDRREEADYHQTGLMQEAYFRPDNKSTISSNLWLMYGAKSIPQPIIVNVTTRERVKDYGLNYYLGYDRSMGKHDLSVKGAYLLNIMRYKESYDSDYFEPNKNFNRMQSFQLKTDYIYNLSEKLYLGASARYSRDIVRAHSSDSTKLTDGTKIKSDWDKGRDIINIQGQVYWKPVSLLAINAHVMGELNDDRFAKTFSTGVSSDVIPNRLNLKASVSYNYKYPSMNELYFVPGGNPLLKPEKGFSYDLTLTYTSKIGDNFYIKSEASGYRMDIDDWTMWLPREDKPSIWSPTNINNVLAQGVEITIKLDYIIDNLNLGLVANYAYTSSKNKNKNSQDDNTKGKQLPYIPLQKANTRLSAEWKNFQFVYNVSYNDKRYTTQDESYQTPAYTIHNAELSYNWKIRNKYHLTPKLSVQNIFDEYYESTQYYPMPLRIISGSLLFTF